MAIEASRNSGGAPTTAIAGNTVAVVMNADALVQALPPLTNIWLCTKIRQFTFPPEYAQMYNNFCESKIVNAKAWETRIDEVSDEIDALQAVAVATLASAIRRHVTTAKYMKKHNKGIRVGFIKPSDCRMTGDWLTR